jgi:hypothetical protein
MSAAVGIGTMGIGSAAIETAGVGPAPGESLGPGNGQIAASVSGKAQNTAGLAGTDSNPSEFSSSGSASFRSGWQALLATLGIGKDGLSKPATAANTANTTLDETSEFGASTSNNEAVNSLTTSHLGTLTGKGWQGKTAREDGQTNSATQLSSSGSLNKADAITTATSAYGRIQASRSQKNLEAQSLLASAAKDPENATSTGSTDHAHPLKAHKNTGQASASTASASTALVTAQATTSTMPLTMAVPASAPAVTSVQEKQEQIASTELSTSVLNNSVEIDGGHSAIASARSAFVAEAASAPAGRAAAHAGAAISANKSATVSGRTPVSANQSQPQGGSFGETQDSSLGSAQRVSANSSDAASARVQAQAQQQTQVEIDSQKQDQVHVLAAGQAAVAAGKQADQQAGAGEAGAGGTVASQAQSSLSDAERTGEKEDKVSLRASTAKTAQGASSTAMEQHAVQVLQAQSTSTAAPAQTAWVRTQADTHGNGSGTSGDAGVSSTSTMESGARATFAALDADTRAGTPAWIHAGSQRAEAGFEDPTLGWVGVRADMGAGGIHASVVSSSADAAQVLGGHMAGLNAFLAEQHTPVETLTMASSSGTSSTLTDQGSMQQGAGQDTGQGASSQSQSNPLPAMAAISRAAVSESTPRGGDSSGGTEQTMRAGNHISVMA